MRGRGAAGWAILVLALAVPGLLFYNWWSRMDREKKRQLNISVRKHTEAAPFAGSENKNRLVNPVAAQAAVSTAAAAQTPAEAAAPAPSPAQPEAAPAPAGPVAASATAALPDFPARDPMLSPYDMVRLKRQELEKMMRASELSVKKIVPEEPPAENNIDLQGIVSAGGVNKAIVNGEVVGEGDTVEGAVILKISDRSVVFRHKNRKFTKYVSR